MAKKKDGSKKLEFMAYKVSPYSLSHEILIENLQCFDDWRRWNNFLVLYFLNRISCDLYMLIACGDNKGLLNKMSIIVLQ